MKQKLLITYCIISLCCMATAQPYFQKSLGPTNTTGSNDIAYSTYQTYDGGYIVCGSTGSYGAGSIDAYIAKFDSAGVEQWAKTYGTANWEATFKLIITSDSGYLFAGGVINADQDILLIKTDRNGSLQWCKKYGGAMGEAASVLESIEQTTDGGYIVTGVTNGYDTIVSNNIFLLKTDAQGDTLWTKVYTAWNFDQALCVHQTFDGGYIVSGRSNSYGAGQMDALLMKTDSTGLITWANCYGGIEPEEGMSVKQTPDSGFIVSGATYSFGPGYADIYINKLDANGAVQWSKGYGAPSVEASYCIIPSQQGGYAVVGFTESFLSPNFSSINRAPQGDDSSNVMLLKIDTAGMLEWSKIYGGRLLDEAYALSQARDGGYLLSATTRSFGSDTTDNGYVIHTDVNGDLDCYSVTVTIQEQTVPTITTPATFNLVYGFTYSNYSLTEAPFMMDDSTLTCITVGLNEHGNRRGVIIVYPNPVTTNCVISAQGFTDAQLTLYDIAGREQWQQHFSEYASINTINLAEGMYVLELTDVNGNTIKQKIVKGN